MTTPKLHPSAKVRPRENGDRPWTRTTVVYVKTGQARAYADEIDIVEVTFEGGCPASEVTAPGCEIPFHTMPPFNHRPLPHGATVIGGPSPEERKATWRKLVLDRIRQYCGWAYDKVGGETGEWHQSYLEEFEHVRGDDFSNTYRVQIRRPYLD